MKTNVIIGTFIASIQVVSAATIILQQPQGQVVPIGSSIQLTVSATNSGVTAYQWKINGTNVPLTLSTIAGTGIDDHTGDGGQATNATLNYPYHVASDKSGNLYIADYNNNCIRKVATNGIITTVAGNGTYGFSGDGVQATNAKLALPVGIAVDRQGNIYFSESDNFIVRRVDTNGIISRVAGIAGSWGYYGDGGPATAANLDGVRGVAIDGIGNLFIADINRNVVRKVSTNGIITTAAGNGSFGYSGDGGQATSAALGLGDPGGIAADDAGNLFIADVYNNCIRKVSTNGIITTIAGNSDANFYGDGGAATSAALNNPAAVAVDNAGNLFIADYYNNRIRRMAPDGNISTVAGAGTTAFNGESGPALTMALNNPSGVATDPTGNIYIVDYNNDRVRKMNSAFLPQLALNNISGAQTGDYTVVISDTAGSVTSSVANVNVVLPINEFTVGFTNNNAQVHITGPANFTYVLQMTTSLKAPVTWTSIATNQADVSGVLDLMFSGAPATASFYRAASP